MKRFVLLLLICLAGAALTLPGAVSGQVDLVSRYIWRGFDLLPDNHAAIQPALTIDLGEERVFAQRLEQFRPGAARRVQAFRRN